MSASARPVLSSLALYGAFAAICAWIHGPQPELNIDHLAYIRKADQLAVAFPAGDFWRAFDARSLFSILLAWLHDLTGDHVISLKLLLAAMTVAWLAASEWLFLSLGLAPARARLAAAIGGLHFGFGAPQWGVSSFSDALHRTLVMPLLFLALGWYWRNRDRDRRRWVLPLAAGLCLVHLGAFYLLAVLGLLECWRLRSAGDARMRAALRLGAAAAAAGSILLLIQFSGLALSTEAAGRLAPGIGQGAGALLSPADAWTVELAALRWRNFPPAAATFLATLASAGPLILFGVAGAWWTRRDPDPDGTARALKAFACAACAVAFGGQAVMWVLRHVLPIYPLNFEEIRAVVWVVPPLIALGLQGLAAPAGHAGRRLVLLAALAGMLLQPAQVVRFLPETWRRTVLGIVAPPTARSPNDLLRARIAAGWLALGDEPRLYYDALGLVDWLRRNSQPGERVLTDRDECRLGPAAVIGSPTGFLDLNLRSPAALAWLALTAEFQEALRSPDPSRVLALAREQRANWVVRPGRHAGAAYADEHYSVIRVSAADNP